VPHAVRFDEHGGIDVLRVVEVDRPVPGPGEVPVRVKAAGDNPGEAKIGSGALARRWPATFPPGEGSDLAGVGEELGEGAGGFAVGDEVLGSTDNRASHAELVVAETGIWCSSRRGSRGRRLARSFRELEQRHTHGKVVLKP